MNFKKYPIFFPAWADLRGKNTRMDGICLTGPNALVFGVGRVVFHIFKIFAVEVVIVRTQLPADSV
jgi:hypothetical protein